jgi:hypothetical protein
MVPAERHPIASFFIDGYLIETILNLIKKILDTNEYFNISIRIFFFIIFIIYHAYYYKKTRFCTIGELLTGTSINKEGQKYYFNPFFINRFVLWIPMFVTFVGIKIVKFDFLSDSIVISSLLFLLIVFFIYFSYLMLNKGHVSGLILLIIVYLLSIFNVIYNKGFIIKSYSDIDLVIEFILYLLFIIILIIYWIIRIKNINIQNQMATSLNKA